MKRIIFSRFCPVLLLLSLIFSGCSAKTAATAEQFQKAAENIGYTVQKQDSGNIESIHLAVKGEDSGIMFYVCSNEQESKTALVNLKVKLPKGVKTEHVDSSYYSRYTAENEKSYYELVRMGRTVLAAAVEKSEKDHVQTLIHELGY